MSAEKKSRSKAGQLHVPVVTLGKYLTFYRLKREKVRI
jgi:hypothetical protein